MIAVNNVYEEISLGIKFRILWINNDNTYAYIIRLCENLKMPITININELRQKLLRKEVNLIDDDFIDLVSFDSLSPQLKSESQKAWDIIKPMVNKEPEIYRRHDRYSLIKKQIAQYKCSDVTIYTYLKRYWAGGMTQNALANRKYQSGGRGKDKFLGSSKTGRPSTNKKGINVDDVVKGHIKESLKKYYFNKESSSYRFAYEMMLLDYYSNKIIGGDGHETVSVLPESPSYRQFTYWANKLYTIDQKTKMKIGEKNYEKDHRGVIGSSVYETNGPGSRFEIDSTPGNVYLVSAYDRKKIIGRPTIYLCVDVFSRLIVGFYAGLESVSSWGGAIALMVNTACNKVELCRKYGIEITEDEWPSAHFPKVILADKAEFIGYDSDVLEENFNISVENTASYRSDMKGSIEKLNDLIPKHIYRFAPGAIEKDYLQRGGKDYRLEAKLTIKEFNTLLIHSILHYNRSYLKTYPFTKAMFEDRVKTKPVDLWNWGINRHSGSLKSYKPSYVYYHLLPRAKGTVKRDGIHFKGARYSCAIAEEENWFATARNKGNWSIEVCFDKRFTEEIYLRIENEIVPCYLLPHQERFFDVTFEDMEWLDAYKKSENVQEEIFQTNKNVSLLNKLNKQTKKFVKNAEKEMNTDSSIPKRQRIKDITTNKNKEKSVEALKEKVYLKNSNKDELLPAEEYENKKSDYRKKSIKDLGFYKGGI